MTEELCRFALRYSGRHRPEDALWWLTRPDEPGPSGARPVQELFLAAADELERSGDREAAAAMLDALALLIEADRRHALDALGGSDA